MQVSVSWVKIYLKFEYWFVPVGSGRNSDFKGLARGTGSCSQLEVALAR